jgi:hypothetical protein
VSPARYSQLTSTAPIAQTVGAEKREPMKQPLVHGSLTGEGFRNTDAQAQPMAIRGARSGGDAGAGRTGGAGGERNAKLPAQADG